MQICLALKKDAREINYLINENFSYVDSTIMQVRSKIRSNKFQIFKTTKKDELIGFIELEKISPQISRINGLIVKEKFQNKRFGKKLLENAINYCKEKEFEKMIAIVDMENSTAEHIYSKFDFKKTLKVKKIKEKEGRIWEKTL